MKVHPVFSAADQQWMLLALAEARQALAAGDYPVGAVLIVDGKLFASARNALFSEGRTTAHAEHTLVATHSATLRTLFRTSPAPQIWMYTTLEPCLMCLGITIMHRVSRIVVACPDPHGGAAQLDVTSIGSGYRPWPSIEIGLFAAESCSHIESFLKTEKFESWREMLSIFEQIRLQGNEQSHP